MSSGIRTGKVRSRDGTSIAFERSGAGPALILVDAASPSGRHCSLQGEWHGVPAERLAPVLAEFLHGKDS